MSSAEPSQRRFCSSLGNSVGIFVVYNFIFAIMSKEVDLSAHGGGLVGGMILGGFLSRKLDQPVNLWRTLAVAVVGTAIFVFFATHLRPIPY